MCNVNLSLASPLHAAVREQFLGSISPERAAPAIFLLAHDEFDRRALLVGALIYSKAVPDGAERLAQCLREEAQLRANRVAANAEVALPATVAGAQSAELVALLSDVSARIGLCARIGGGPFNDGVRTAQKEVEAAILRLPRDQPPVPT